MATVSTHLEVAGRTVRLEVTDCTLHRGGEFGGNVDLSIRFQPNLPEKLVVESLGLKVPGEPEPLTVLGSAVIGDRHEVTFHSVALTLDRRAPPTVELLWGAELRCLATLETTSVPEPPV